MWAMQAGMPTRSSVRVLCVLTPSKRKCRYRQAQTRSADEPMTVRLFTFSLLVCAAELCFSDICNVRPLSCNVSILRVLTVILYSCTVCNNRYGGIFTSPCAPTHHRCHLDGSFLELGSSEPARYGTFLLICVASLLAPSSPYSAVRSLPASLFPGLAYGCFPARTLVRRSLRTYHCSATRAMFCFVDSRLVPAMSPGMPIQPRTWHEI